MRVTIALLLGLVLGAAAAAGEDVPKYDRKSAEEWAETLLEPWQWTPRSREVSPAEVLLQAREEAWPVVQALTSDPRPAVRALVADRILGRLDGRARDLAGDPLADRAARRLLELLADDSAEVRAAAARGLGAVAVARWDEFLPPPTDTLASDVANSVIYREIREPGPILRVAEARLRALLDDPEEAVRKAAEQSLGWLREDPGPPEPTVAELVALLAPPAKDRAVRSAWRLAALGPAAADAVPALETAVRTRAFLRRDAIRALGAIGPAAAAALPAIVGGMRDGIATDRPAAALAVWRISGEVDRPLATLRNALKSDDERVKWHALVAAMEMGDTATPLSEAIAARLDDPSRFVRQVALAAFRRASPDAEAVAAAHVQGVLDPDVYVRTTAARGISLLPDPPEEALDALIDMLDDSLVYAEVQAAAAIAALGPKAARAAGPLGEHLVSNSPAIRRELLDALTAIGPPGIARLRLATSGHRHPWVRGEATERLGGLDDPTDADRKALRRLLDDPSEYVRRKAAVALVRAGGDPALALAVVRASLDSDDPLDRARAAEAPEAINRYR